jgi:hypothetical protein
MITTGSCHCGSTTFRIVSDVRPEYTGCTCSFCAMRTTRFAYVQPDQFLLTSAAGRASIFARNTGPVIHYQCATCGCITHVDSPTFAADGSCDDIIRRIGVNQLLFDEVEQFERVA